MRKRDVSTKCKKRERVKYDVSTTAEWGGKKYLQKQEGMKERMSERLSERTNE